MKIIYVVPRLNNAGPINQLYNLISALNYDDCYVKVITMYAENEDSRWRDFEKKNISVECLGLKGKLSIFCIGNMLRNKVMYEKPDIIHSEGLPADLAVLFSRLKDFFWLSTIHCNIYADYKTRFHKWAWIQIFLHRCCMQKMNKIICCSNSIKPIYEEEFGNKVISIQNGVFVEHYRVLDNNSVLELRKMLHISTQKKIILVVGSIDERKNSIFIINNIKEWLRKNKVQLVFLGTGPFEQECKKSAEGFDILFKGHVENVQDYLKCADAYLSASISEGLPLSVLEAGTYGLELFLSDIEQHKEIAMYDGNIGINFFDINDGIKMISILDKLNKQDETLKMKISQYFNKHFSANTMSEKYYLEYKRISDERGMI